MDGEILHTPSAEAASAVHGISDDEIFAGTPFTTVRTRFLDFVQAVFTWFSWCDLDLDLGRYVPDEGDNDAEAGPPRPPDEPPTLLLMAAHNGYACSRRQ